MSAANKFTSYYKVAQPVPVATAMSDSQNMGDQASFTNYVFYQRLIQGSASRIIRYREYDIADNDVEIARSLDTIAEEMTGNAIESSCPLEIQYITPYGAEPTKSRESAAVAVEAALHYWSELMQLDRRMFGICRTASKYGDCFFIKNKKGNWEYIHPKNVAAAIVDEHDMTNVLGWQIRRNIKTPTGPFNSSGQSVSSAVNITNTADTDVYSSEDVVWFSLGDDISESAPFGESVLRAVYKAQKQKELLEDSVIIYRLVRAPERRVFYIDVGKMPPHKVKGHLEQIKNEYRQRHTPSYGGQNDQVDAVYNPMSTSEDIFLGVREGRGTKIDTLPAGCFSMDTRVVLLDGTTMTIEQVAEHHNNGKELWTYSVNPMNGEIVPAPISWAGVTRENAEVLEITLDNNKTIVCTYDHKFPVVGSGIVEAQSLSIGDQLFAFNDRTIDSTNAHGYQVFQPTTKQWVSAIDTFNENIDDAVIYDNVFGSESIMFTPQAHNLLSLTTRTVAPLLQMLKLTPPGYVKVKSVRALNTTMQVGTLTIDFEEKFHDHHNFPLAVGVFTQNSNTGVIDDLKYFQWKVYRGLRIPLSYMSEEDSANVTDGANAYVSELRFALYIMRLQKSLNRTFDQEFKSYLRQNGIKFDPYKFRVKLPAPENFGIYRQQAIDSELLNSANAATSLPGLSTRFIFERYMGLTEAEIKRNERLKLEEMGIDPDSKMAEDLTKVYGGDDHMNDPMQAGSLGGSSYDFGDMSSGSLDVDTTNNTTEFEMPTFDESPPTDNETTPQ